MTSAIFDAILEQWLDGNYHSRVVFAAKFVAVL